MRADAKKYMNSVVAFLMEKHSLKELDAYKMVKKSFLYDSLEKFPDETIHDDIEMNAQFVYEDFIQAEDLLQM